MNPVNTFVRRYGVLALSILLIVIGGVLLAQPAPTTGWTAYAPLSHTTFTAAAPIAAPFLIGAFLAGAGVAFLCTWIGLAIARRRHAVPPSAWPIDPRR